MSEPSAAVKKKEFLHQFHTERFTWHDYITIITLVVILLTVLESVFGSLITAPLTMFLDKNQPYVSVLLEYFITIGAWVATIGYILITKYNRPIIHAITPRMKGNNWKMLGLGLLVGFVQNAFCILVAAWNKDIHLTFSGFEFFRLLILLIAVFIQSSSEELICRGFIYQRLKRGHKSPLVWILGNSLIFAALHLANPGITFLAFMNIVLVAIFYSLVIYYFDASIWFTMAAHAAWNFTQNILFGLPNSGIVSGYSMMLLDTANARNSFAYNINFGVEGTLLACIVIAVSIAVTWYFGSKRQPEDIDVWEIADAAPENN